MLAGGIFRQENPLRNANRSAESIDFRRLFTICAGPRRLPAPAKTTLVYRGAEMLAREFSLAGSATRRACLLVLLGAAPACQRNSGPAPAAERAEQTFRTVCGRCHGGDGTGGVAPEGVNAPRNFRDAAFQASRTDEQLKQAIRLGKGAMPGFGNLFSDADLQGLVLKIRSFDPGAKKP